MAKNVDIGGGVRPKEKGGGGGMQNKASNQKEKTKFMCADCTHILFYEHWIDRLHAPL